jgi:hypothetical protein
MPQLEVTGTLQTVHALVPLDKNGIATAPAVEESTYLMTDSGERIPVEGELPEGATSGATLEGTLALTVAASAELSVAPDVAAEASDEPLASDDEASQEILAEATTEQVPLPIAEARITPAAAVAVSTTPLAHKFYVAIVGPKSSSVKHTSYSSASVKKLVSKVSTYWKAQSGGVVAGITVAKTVRFTSATSCAGSVASVQKWWTEAAGKFTKSPNEFFGQGTGRHLVVLTPDGTKMSGPCGKKLGFTGLGTIGQSSADGGFIQSIVGSSMGAATLAHEFGHNLSLGHANIAVCTSATISEAPGSTCGIDEYYDLYDVMGATVYGQKSIPSLSLPAKERLGFLDGDEVTQAALTDGSASQSFTQVITPISSSTGVRGVHVTDPISGKEYWVELRNGGGTDKGILANSPTFELCSLTCSTSSQYSYGTGVRILAEDRVSHDQPETLALAIAPDANKTATTRTLSLGTLDGFASKSGGVTVEVDWVTAKAASVTVTLTSSPALVPATRGSSLSGYASLDQTLGAPEQFFRQVGVTRSFQWLRNGDPIAGATGSSYRVQSDDVGQDVSVAVTAQLSGFPSTTAVSHTVKPSATPNVLARNSAPAIAIAPDPASVAGSGVKPYVIVYNGAGKSGSVSLSSISPVLTSVASATAFDADGIAIIAVPWTLGATPQEIVGRLSDGRETAAVGISPDKRATALSLTLSASKIRLSKTVKATVGFPSLAKYPKMPTGTVEFYLGGELVASTVLGSKSTASILLPKFATTGTKKLTAVYVGDAHHLGDSSVVRAVKVVR